MRIAVAGSGISGLVAAHLLSADHEVTLFEADSRLGGHTHTVDVDRPDGRFAVDTGFIVFNDRTYPGFCKLIDRLGVAWQPSDMSFSVRCETTGLEYNGTSYDTLFAQRRNLFRPSFLRMLSDIVRFHREAKKLLTDGAELSFGAWLAQGRWSREFREHYLFPMCAAIWSSSLDDVARFPARNFARFFENHGMLSVDDRPRWRTLRGGSRSYIPKLIAPFADRVRLSSPVTRIARHADKVEVTSRGVTETYDHVVVAAHADQALRVLADPSDAEREILSAIPYRPNDTVLHTDRSVMPRTPRAWAAWNFHLLRERTPDPTVTYDMNRLQSIPSRESLLVTLNRTKDLDPARILGRYSYEHPCYSTAAVAAQARRDEIQGVRRTWYCGAYWGWGFHEDGLQSALHVTRRFGRDL